METISVLDIQTEIAIEIPKDRAMARKPSTECVLIIRKKKRKNHFGPFLWIRFTSLETAESLCGDSLLLTFKFPGVPGTHLIDHKMMKG